MAEVSAFAGLRYDPARLGDLSSVLSPPYDVIGPELQGELYGRALQNVVRVELGKQFAEDRPGISDRYTRARDQLRIWLEQGFVVEDREPSLYLYRQSFRPPGGGGPRERLGCFAGLEPVPHERGEVLRHELTLSGPKEDRLRLLQTARVQTSAVFLLYEGGAEVSAALRSGLREGEAIGEAVTEGEYGRERHQLWRLSAPELVQTICGGLSATRLFIADGHHRYETALNLGLPRVLALLSPLDDPGNVVLPTHRLLKGSPFSPEQLAGRLADAGWQTRHVAALEEGLQALAGLRGGEHAFLLAGAFELWLVHRPREGGSMLRARDRLDVAVLENEILEPYLGLSAEDAAAGRLLYSRSAEEVAALAEEPGALGLLLNPTTVQEMAEVAVAGEAMPQKSTYFYPKVPAGLVMMRVDPEAPFSGSPDSGTV